MLLNLIKRFKNDRRGNFAMITVIAFPAVFGCVALGIDVANHLRLRTELQNANDTGVLFATRYFQVNNRLPTNAQVEEFVQANYTGGTVSNINMVFDRQDNRMTVTSESNSKPMLMSYFGFQNTQMAALSQANLGVNGTLEFALALDTTESMLQDDRIGGLKTAANNFVDILYDMKDRGADVKGAVVPFARYVNVGVSRKNEPWMDVPDDIDTRETTKVCRTERPVTGEINCRMVFTAAYVNNIPATPRTCRIVDGFEQCTPGQPARTENVAARNDRVCDPVYGAEVTTCGNETTGQLLTWKGCVSSRPYPLNVSDAFAGTKFPGVLDVDCASEILPLSSSRTALVKKINGLVPQDDTYIPEGVMWGMRMLTQAQPFTEGKPATGNAKPVRKALVVMTDGKNSLSPEVKAKSPSANGIVHTGRDEALANRYTTESCNAAKAEGLEVYTISFGNQVPNEIRDLLEACASKPQLYFHASNSAALNDAFNKIADELLSIRLTQ
jgi:Flp pilus assembly protein TadG